jgi:hypothetical protein
MKTNEWCAGLAEVVPGEKQSSRALIAMDNDRYFYVSDTADNDVNRWRVGDTFGTLVASDNGRDDRLDQFNDPYYIFVDQNQSVYVSDNKNHPVIK